jgi:hypothetical protein
MPSHELARRAVHLARGQVVIMSSTARSILVAMADGAWYFPAQHWWAGGRTGKVDGNRLV